MALVEPGESRRVVTYGALDHGAMCVAAALCATGLAPGDRIALIGDNGVDLVTAWLGAFALGLVVVPLPPMSTPVEIASRVRHARCRAVIAAPGCAPRVAEAVPELVCHAPATLCASPIPLGVPADLPADALAMLLYTSGTTGAPRGVMITHASLITHTASIVHHVLGLDASDVVAGFLPLSHSYGVRMTLLAPFYAGAKTVLMPRFDAGRALAHAHAEGITWWPMVPTMASAIAREPAVDLPRLRFATSAGAPLAPDVRTRAEATLGVPVCEAYGLTEATFSTIDVPADARGRGTVGRAVPGVELAIVDPEGAYVARGTLGEILVRGQNVTAGYLDDPAATRASRTDDGFLRTGDLGRLDAEGRLVVVDRLKDLIVRGGFNVVPAEVEAVLARHEDVRGVAVVGIADAHFGEEIVAVIESAEDLAIAALDDFARASLSPVKVPRWYVFVRSIPLGTSGKIVRRELRDALMAGKLTMTRVPN